MTMVINKRESVYSLSQEESKRIRILKFLCIILVVYIHSYNQGMDFTDEIVSLNIPVWLRTFENILSQGIARMAVPMFFLLSAVLLFKCEQNYKSLMVKKTKRLLIPYLFWNTLWIFLFFILQRLTITYPYFSNSNNMVASFQFKDWLEAYGISLYKPPFLYPFWFLRDLMVMNALYPLFRRVINRLPFLALIISLVMIFIPFPIPFGVAIGFFLLGGCVVKFNFRMEKIDKIPFGLVFVFYVVILFCKLIISSNMVNGLSILLGIIFFFKISKYIYRNNLIYARVARLLPYTFIIYAGHELILSGLKKVCLSALPHTDLILFSQYFLLPIFVIAGCIFVACILKKYFIKVYIFVIGERQE